MKCLVYAILNTLEIRKDPLPCGIDESEVSVLADDGLALVFSWVKEETTPPDRSRLLAFARVIAELGVDRTILPVCYGTLLENEDQAKKLLRSKHDAFATALADVDGCVEMSLRILTRDACSVDRGPCSVDRGPWTEKTTAHGSRSTAHDSRPPSDGIAYILWRRIHYLDQDNVQRLEEGHVGHCREAFAGLFVRCRSEWSNGPLGRYPAIHFLVRRENLERFRQAFRHMEEIESDPVLLTGPWVPYNFVNLPSDGLLP